MARPKLPVSPNQPGSRQTARWLLILVGVVLAGSISLDVYRDWMPEGHLLSTTLAENILPLLVSIGVPVLG